MSEQSNLIEGLPGENGHEPVPARSNDHNVLFTQFDPRKVAELTEAAKSAATATAESQKLAEDALADVRAKLAEVTTVATHAAVAATAETQKQVAALFADSQSKLVDITTTATQAVAARTQIADNQAVIATKSDHIQKAQEHADKVRADLDRALTAATQQATEAEAQRTAAQSSAENAAELLSDLRTTRGTAETEANGVTEARKAAEAAATRSKALAEKSVEVERRLADYENRLNELAAESATQLKTIEGLLPGATSAGLAHAWDERRQTFLKPHNRWQLVFVGSLLALVLLAITGLWHVYNEQQTPTYDELFRLWLARLPVAAALIWLALHASRESALAKRLEEDYGYKSAISSCYEGFRKQMSEVGSDVAPGAPVAKLSENTLATIASPPGRIYDKHELTVSPTDELKQAAKAAAEVANAVKPIS